MNESSDKIRLINKAELNIHSLLFAVLDAWKEDPSNSMRPLRRNSHMKYQSRSLRLCHNNITDLHDLHKPVSHFLAEPSHLAWLDLSFNKISHIDRVMFHSPWVTSREANLYIVIVVVTCNMYALVFQVLCELRELRVLYLHANSISILPEVDRLGALPLLHTITLHGNVIETNKAYRWDNYKHTHPAILFLFFLNTEMNMLQSASTLRKSVSIKDQNACQACRSITL